LITAPELRRRLLSPHDAARLGAPGRTNAAVLVPIYDLDGEMHAVFTRRRDDLRRHAGEISFPGGRQDAETEDLRETALREAEEEIGLSPEDVQIVGALRPTPTLVTSYAIYPFVGTIEPRQRWVPSDAEVAEVLELSLPGLLAGHSRQRLLRRGVPFRTDVYELDGHLIWGATARILSDLFERLAPLLG
jgi:8-oxo-dGTP pyrophosphatase MutT (NUDIX family)